MAMYMKPWLWWGMMMVYAVKWVFLQQIHYWCKHDIRKFALGLHIYCFFWPVYIICCISLLVCVLGCNNVTACILHSYTTYMMMYCFYTLRDNFPLSHYRLPSEISPTHAMSGLHLVGTRMAGGYQKMMYLVTISSLRIS